MKTKTLAVSAVCLLAASAQGFAQAVQMPPPLPTPAATATTPTPAATDPTRSSPKPRTEADAVTPAIKDRARHDDHLYRIKQGPVGLAFIGDSITDFWPHRGEWTWLKFAKYQPGNFGISADRTEHVLWRLTNGELDGIDPKVTVIMIGTNNIGQQSTELPEWAAAGITKIVETVREKLPKTKILLLAIFPRGVANGPERPKIAKINEIISKLDDGKTIRFLDIGPKFLDEAGEIPADIMPDKLHPGAKGYEIWYNAMNPLLEEMMR